MSEARILIEGVALDESQSMAVRVAVAGMLTELANPEYSRELGDIATLYKKCLSEVQFLIIQGTK